MQLETHFKQLAANSLDIPCDIIVVRGAGFTCLEAATELPSRIRGIRGTGSTPRIVLAGNATEVGPESDPHPRPVIT
jgi:NADH:ubiquinone reductase (H+-translocating)